MRKWIAYDAKITGSTAKTARVIFKSSKRLGIIFLLTEKAISVREIQRITGDSGALISYHLVALEREQIVKRTYEKGLIEVFFKVNGDIRDEIIEIINSFLSIQDVLEEYKRDAELEMMRKVIYGKKI